MDLNAIEDLLGFITELQKRKDISQEDFEVTLYDIKNHVYNVRGKAIAERNYFQGQIREYQKMIKTFYT